MIIPRIHNFLKSLLLKERCPEKLALSLAVGTYIGFSPFVGMHTALTMAIAWLFGLNFAVMWISSHLINNPWTMIPVYSADYFFGEWLLSALMGIDSQSLNPSWMIYINQLLTQHAGIHVSFWSFLVGGNVLGLLMAIGAYPFFKRLCSRVAAMTQPI